MVNQSTPQQNLIPNQPTMKDVLDQHRRDIMLNLSCLHIGTIQSFDAEVQTASATINYKKTIFQRDAVGNYQAVLVDYPIALDCPVVVLGGSNAALTMPIAVGDECLIFFNDRDLDNWFAGASPGAVATPRLHSFSDGVILVGINSLNNSWANYDSVRAVLRNGNALVGVGPELIKVANELFTLNNLVQELITNVKNLVTATATLTVTGVTAGAGTSGPPSNAATITAIGTALTELATDFGELLE